MPLWKKAWEKWMAFAEIFGTFMSGVILSILYLTLVLPYGLAIRFFSDPLRIKSLPPHSNWKDLPSKSPSLDVYRKQY